MEQQPQDPRIMATAEHALTAKEATVQAGYYQDDFLSALAGCGGGATTTTTTTASRNHFRQQQKPPAPPHQRRHIQPIIKRGTHARVCCMDRAISTFLQLSRRSSSSSSHQSQSQPSCQIVVLGAGKDTSYFRWRAGQLQGMQQQQQKQKQETPNNNNSPQKNNVHWYEVDHSLVVQDKARTIQNSPLLSQYCPSLERTPHGFACSSTTTTTEQQQQQPLFSLIEHDLREDPKVLVEKLGLNPEWPTLYLLECVFMYVPAVASQTLLQGLATSAKQMWVILYEPILMADPFGRMMEQNLVKAGVATSTSCLLQTRTLESQLSKFLQAGGYHKVVGCDMWSAYETIMTQDQRRRANQAEFLDELEEWMLIMRHYCFVAAHGGTSTTTTTLEDPLTSIGTFQQPSALGFCQGKCQVRTQP